MTDNSPPTPVDAQALAQRGIEQPLHRERLSLVASGVGEYSSWELHDGPHPTDDDPHAVASSITITSHAADGHRPRWVGQVGTALAPDDIVDIVGISSNAGIGPVPYGHIYARCRADVSAARFHFDDETTTLIAAATSPTTGQRWIICELHNPASPVHIDFLNEHGDVITNRTTQDPRRRRHQLPTHP